MAERTIMTKGLGGKNKPVTSFGKIDPVFKTWKYGGCGQRACGMPSTPKEYKESKTWQREDAKFFRKAVQNTGYGKDKKAMKRVREGDIGIKSGELFKGYGNSRNF